MISLNRMFHEFLHIQDSQHKLLLKMVGILLQSKDFRIANKNEIILYLNKYISKNLINKIFLTVYLHKDILKVNARHKTY